MKAGILFLTLFFLLIFSVSAGAEYIFLKDGSIVKGTIYKDTDKIIYIKADRGYKLKVKRSEILRISYDKSDLAKQKIELVSGKTIQVYIVGEDQAVYIVRARINSADEITINKKDVLKIIQNRPSKLNADIKWPNVILQWDKPFKKTVRYYVYLAEENKPFPKKPYRVVSTNRCVLKKLRKGAIYQARVTAIGDDSEESVPSNVCLINYNSAPVEKVRSELIDRENLKFRLSWDAPMKNIRKYRVYRKSPREDRLQVETKTTELILRKKAPEDVEYFYITTINEQGNQSVSSPVVNTYFLDAWYLTVTGVVSVPMGFLADDFTAGTGVSVSASNAFDSMFFWGGSVSTVYNFSKRTSVLPGSGMVSTFFDAFAGMNFTYMNKHLIIQPYLMAGCLWSYVTEGESGSHGIDPSYGIGLKVPFNVGMFVVPFAEYRWIPDSRAYQGHILIGVGVSL